MELDLLSDLNNILSSANEAADAPWQPPLSKRQHQAAGVCSSSDEEEDLPGPGAYDVKVVATGKRVVGGKWGSAPRSDVSAKRKSSRGEDVVPGPGAYEPNRPMKEHATTIAPVAKPKPCEAARLKEREEIERARGPGRYDPDFGTMSTEKSSKAARIAPLAKPALPLVMKQLLDHWESSAVAPGSYTPDIAAVKKQTTKTPVWRESSSSSSVCAAKETDDMPGPGAYDANYAAIRPRTVANVQIIPATDAVDRQQDFPFPGPGTYDVDDGLIHPRAKGVKICPPLSTEANQERSEGDVLLLDPKIDATRRSVSCSAVMREASFVSQASTRNAADDSFCSDYSQGHEYLDDSFLSTTRRPKAASFAQSGVTRDVELDARDVSPGPGKYDIRYESTERRSRHTEVLRSGTLRDNPWFPAEGDGPIDGNVLVLHPEKGEEYLMKNRGVPDMSRQTDRSTDLASSNPAAGLAYDVDDSVMKPNLPSLNMRLETGRKDSVLIQKDSDPELGPGKYDVDDSLVQSRTPAAFFGSEGQHGVEDDDLPEGDVLELDVIDADAARRSGVKGVVDFGRQSGRKEEVMDSGVEPLFPDDAPLRPHIASVSMDLQTGRSWDEEEEEDKVYGKYTPDYKHVEKTAVTGVVDFGVTTGRGWEDTGEDDERQDGDVLVLHPEKGEEYLMKNRGVPDMSRQTDRSTDLASSNPAAGLAYDVDDSVMKPNLPSLNMRLETGRKDSVLIQKDSDPELGPGKYDVDDSLVQSRTPAAFFGSEGQHGVEDDDLPEGDVLELDVIDADAARRSGVKGVVDFGRQSGRKEEVMDSGVEPLFPDDAPLRPHIASVSMDLQTGRSWDEEEEEDKVYGKYTPDYKHVEKTAVTGVVDFGVTTGRGWEDTGEDDERQDGDVLVLHPEKGEEYLMKNRGVPDMSRQTERPDFTQASTSDFTGEELAYNVDYSALDPHVPEVDFVRTAGRKEDRRLEESADVGPGKYDVDDSAVHPKAPSAFFPTEPRCGNGGDEEDLEDVEGDALYLDVEAAHLATRAGPKGLVSFENLSGRSDHWKVGEGETPEALDYDPDVDAFRRRVPGFEIEKMSGRGGGDDEDEENADKVYGKYTPNFRLVEMNQEAGAIDFGRQTGRDSENSDEDEDERREGDVLFLRPERGSEYLKKNKGAPDMSKQTERPDFTQASTSDFTGDETTQKDVNYAQLDTHVPSISMNLTTGRSTGVRHDGTGRCTCEFDWRGILILSDPECPLTAVDEPLGPGAYNTDDAAIRPRGYAAFIAPPGEDAGSEDGDDDDGAREGDVLVLDLAKADEATRRRVKDAVKMVEPALESEWGTRERGAGLPSIASIVQAKREEEAEIEASKPTFYDVGGAEQLLRHGAYTGTASIALEKQVPRAEKARHGISLAAPASRGGLGGLPKIKGISTDGYVALSGAALKPGDEVVMITRKDGTTADLRSFVRPDPPPRGASSQPPKVKGVKIQATLGKWQQVMSAKHGAFFSHSVSGQRYWKIPDGPSEVVKLLMEELETDINYPITLHVRRRPQLTTLIQVEVGAICDANFAAYSPAHTLTEAGPRGVADMARGVGREGVSAEEGAGMRLFAKQLLYDAKRGLPEFSLISGEGVGEQEEEVTVRHEMEYRKLVDRQRVEEEEEKSKAEARGDTAEAESLFKGVRERHAKERASLIETQRLERGKLGEGIVVKTDLNAVEAEVMRLVHAKKLQLGTSERLKETELQRRKRHGRGVDGGAGSTGGGNHVASYSHAMPDTPSRWLEPPQNLTVSDSEVAEWRRAAAYKGLQKTDQVVKWFWQLLESWSPKRRSLLLQFATGTGAVPKGGFETLSGHHIASSDKGQGFTLARMQPKLLGKVQIATPNGKPLVPRAFTAMNRLYLPEYRSKRDLQGGLEAAIEEMRKGGGRGGIEEVRDVPAGGLRTEIMCRKPVDGGGGAIFTIMEGDED